MAPIPQFFCQIHKKFVYRTKARCEEFDLYAMVRGFGDVFCRSGRGGVLLSSPKEETRKVPPFRIGGRRVGGLTPNTPAPDSRQAISLPPALGPTLRAEGHVPQPAAKQLRKMEALRPDLLSQTGNNLPIRKALRPDKRLRDR